MSPWGSTGRRGEKGNWPEEVIFTLGGIPRVFFIV